MPASLPVLQQLTSAELLVILDKLAQKPAETWWAEKAAQRVREGGTRLYTVAFVEHEGDVFITGITTGPWLN